MIPVCAIDIGVVRSQLQETTNKWNHNADNSTTSVVLGEILKIYL